MWYIIRCHGPSLRVKSNTFFFYRPSRHARRFICTRHVDENIWRKRDPRHPWPSRFPWRAGAHGWPWNRRPPWTPGQSWPTRFRRSPWFPGQQGDGWRSRFQWWVMMFLVLYVFLFFFLVDHFFKLLILRCKKIIIIWLCKYKYLSQLQFIKKCISFQCSIFYSFLHACDFFPSIFS